MTNRSANLILEDGNRFEGELFGYNQAVAGEVVFNTGMVGYPETFTDPSYFGQILCLTFPLIGNYGVPEHRVVDQLDRFYESEKCKIRGLLVSDYSFDHSHWNAEKSLARCMNHMNYG